jgi:tetratricopeptide (TPR) repeat protein
MRGKRIWNCAVLALGLVIVSGGWVGSARAASDAEAVAQRDSARRGEAYTHLMRSLFLMRKSEFRASTGEIRRALELQPDSVELHVQSAILLARMGRRSDAEALGRKALELDPDDPEALRFLADLAFEQLHASGRPDEARRSEAVRLYERLVELEVENADVLQRLAGLRVQVGDRQGAIDVIQQLLEHRPGDRDAMRTLAQLYLEDGREAEALRVVLLFIAKHPNDTTLVRLTQRLANEIDGWAQVAEILEREGQLGPSNAAAHQLLGQALLELDRPSEAVVALERARAADPVDRSVRYDLASSYRHVGRNADAASIIRELTDEEPSDPRALLLLAETLEQQGDVDGALNAFASALRILSAESQPEGRPVRDAIRRRMVTLYLENEQVHAARGILDQVEQPELPESIELGARIAIANEDWGAARQGARRIREAGDGPIADFLEGELHILTGRWIKAEEKLAAAIGELGLNARIRAAELYLDAGNPEPGIALLSEWTRRSPDSAAAHYYLGSYMYRADRAADGERELREAFRLDPLHAPALNFLGYSLAERNIKLDEALQMIERALTIDGFNGAYLDSLGWVYFQLGRFADAQAPLEQAAREFPHDATVLEHLGDLYFELGQHERAFSAWTRAMNAGPEDSETLRAKIERQATVAEGSGTDATDEPQSVDSRIEPPQPQMKP